MNDSGMTLTSWGVCIALLIFVFLMMKFFILILRLPEWFSTKWPNRWIDCRDPVALKFREPLDKIAKALTEEKKWGSVYSRFNKRLNRAELFSQESDMVIARIRAYESIVVWWTCEVDVESELPKENKFMIYDLLTNGQWRRSLRTWLGQNIVIHVRMEALS